MLPTLAAEPDATPTRTAPSRPGPPPAWSSADRRVIDDALFDPACWFALDATNRRVPRAAVVSLEAGLAMVGKHRVRSIVGRLRPGVLAVDIDAAGMIGHALAEAVHSWCARRDLWSLVRPSGGADGRAHVFVLLGPDDDHALRAHIAALRERFAVSRPQLDVREAIRPLSAPHRSGADTTPYGDPRLVLDALHVHLGATPLPVARPRRRRDRPGEASRPEPHAARRPALPGPRPAPATVGAPTGVPRPARRRGVTPGTIRELPPAWNRYLRCGTRPMIAGSDTSGRSNYEAILTGHLVRAGHTPQTAWTLIQAAHPAAMTKARSRGQRWWTTTVWNGQVRDLTAYRAARLERSRTDPDLAAAVAAVAAARVRLRDLAWALPRRQRPAFLLVGHVVLDRIARTGRARVPVPERDLHEDTGLSRRTIRHHLRHLGAGLGRLHTDHLDRCTRLGRATTSFEFELRPGPGGVGQTVPPCSHTPAAAPAGRPASADDPADDDPAAAALALRSSVWLGLGATAHQLWRALPADGAGVAIVPLLQRAALTDTPDQRPGTEQLRHAEHHLRVLAQAGLATCDADGTWRAATTTTPEHAERARARYEHLHQVVVAERDAYRAGVTAFTAARDRALAANTARQRTWWNTLTPQDRRARLHQVRERLRESAAEALVPHTATPPPMPGVIRVPIRRSVGSELGGATTPGSFPSRYNVFRL